MKQVAACLWRRGRLVFVVPPGFLPAGASAPISPRHGRIDDTAPERLPGKVSSAA